MKVFLSHSTKDKQFVETLAAELEAEKIEPWLCEIDIEFGDNFVAKIEDGLRDADLTILFWSPKAASSDWTRLEWTSVTAREISESRTRLGIVLLRDCTVPELLRVKHRIDARTDPGKARRVALEWIKRLRDTRRLTRGHSKPATLWNRKQLLRTTQMRDQGGMSNVLTVCAQALGVS